MLAKSCHSLKKTIIQYKPSELAFEYKAIVNVEIGLVLSEDQVLWDTAYVPLTEAFTS